MAVFSVQNIRKTSASKTTKGRSGKKRKPATSPKKKIKKKQKQLQVESDDDEGDGGVDDIPGLKTFSRDVDDDDDKTKTKTKQNQKEEKERGKRCRPYFPLLTAHHRI